VDAAPILQQPGLALALVDLGLLELTVRHEARIPYAHHGACLQDSRWGQSGEAGYDAVMACADRMSEAVPVGVGVVAWGAILKA
jgi:hypothetical protein